MAGGDLKFEAWDLDNMTTILTIAGSDPSGGAGIQADLRIFDRLGVEGLSAITAITAQTNDKFLSIHPVPADILTQQLSAASECRKIDAIKIGMVATQANVQAIIWFLKRFSGIPVIVDPVFDASTGYPLIEPEALPAFEQHLLPLATVVTPNLDEASTLAKMQVACTDTMETAAKNIHENIRRLRGGGGKELAIIVKGGHLKNHSPDFLYDGRKITKIDGEYVEKKMHGTGCAYSSALAAYLVLGKDIVTAAEMAKEFVTGLINK